MTTPFLIGAFFLFLVATVIALGAVLVLGHQGRTKPHVRAVCVMVALLIVTLVFAELLGRRYTFEPLVYSIHMAFAYASSLALPAPLASGVLHLKGKLGRKIHVLLARVWVVLVVAALGTGVWMFAGATPKAAETAAPAPAVD